MDEFLIFYGLLLLFPSRYNTTKFYFFRMTRWIGILFNLWSNYLDFFCWMSPSTVELFFMVDWLSVGTVSVLYVSSFQSVLLLATTMDSVHLLVAYVYFSCTCVVDRAFAVTHLCLACWTSVSHALNIVVGVDMWTHAGHGWFLDYMLSFLTAYICILNLEWSILVLTYFMLAYLIRLILSCY